jgi:hypothetical protein
VRGVGDEPSLGVERTLEALEQPVDRVRELSEFVARSLHRQPLVAVDLRHLPGGGGHRPQGCQHPPAHDPAERAGHDRHDRERDARLDHELVQVRDALRRADGEDHLLARR